MRMVNKDNTQIDSDSMGDCTGNIYFDAANVSSEYRNEEHELSTQDRKSHPCKQDVWKMMKWDKGFLYLKTRQGQKVIQKWQIM